MKTSVQTVEDTIGNQELCKKYCGSCPTFRGNNLSESSPNVLFCARGTAATPSPVKTAGCHCPACEVFTKNKLVIGYFCAKR
jgi:hypothetical protein